MKQTEIQIKDPDNGCLTLEALQLYAGERLDGRVANEIEKHLEDCPLCTNALEGIREHNNPDAFKVIVDSLNRQILEKVQGNTDKNKKPARLISFPRSIVFITSAAAVIILLFLILPGGNTLPAGFYETYPGDVVRGNKSEAIVSKAMADYNKAAYASAIPLFEELQNPKGWFFAGNSNFELKNYEAAIADYEKVIAANDEFSEDAKWYRALALISINNKEEGRNALENIAAGNGDYADQAKKLVQEIQ